jgi:hypothetical protein
VNCVKDTSNREFLDGMGAAGKIAGKKQLLRDHCESHWTALSIEHFRPETWLQETKGGVLTVTLPKIAASKSTQAAKVA